MNDPKDQEVDDLLSQLDDKPDCDAIGCPPPEILPVLVSPQAMGSAVVLRDHTQAEPVVDVAKCVARHEAISDEILGSWRSDRAEANDAIGLIRGLIDDTIAKGLNPTGTVLEVYVGAIKAKSDTNANAIKLLDATVKLLAATKSNLTVNNTQNNTIINDLDMLLSDPVRDDDV